MKPIPLWHLPFFSSGDLSGGLVIFPSVLGLFATSAVYFNVSHVQGQPVSLSRLAISSLCFVTGVVLGVFWGKRAKSGPRGVLTRLISAARGAGAVCSGGWLFLACLAPCVRSYLLSADYPLPSSPAGSRDSSFVPIHSTTA